MRHALLLVALLWSAQATAVWLSEQQGIMGTEVSVRVWSEDSPRGQAAIDAVMADMHRIDAAFSPYVESSELSRVNRLAAQAAVRVSDELFLLVERALHYGALSDGAFDITYASVGHLYDYRALEKPDGKQTQQLLQAVDYRLLKLDQTRQTLTFNHPDMTIDLGGIAKGYAVDRAIAILAEHGIEYANVSAGGDSKMLGDKRGEPWLIGIKNPRMSEADERPVVLRMPLEDTAVSTSGDYERYFIDSETGDRVHHIINPSTGLSASGIMSVTVLGPNGLDTDPLSTTVFVLGVEGGLALIESLPQYEAVIIDAAGQVHYSRGLAPPPNPLKQ